MEALPPGQLPYLDRLMAQLAQAGPAPEHPLTVLVAPSWGTSGLLSVYGSRLLDALLRTDYHIIVRPHPQSFISEKELMDGLMAAYPDSDRLEWDRSGDNFGTLRRSDVMISDFSGVMFDFSLVFDRPVIYSDTTFDKSPYDAWWLDEDLWTFSILEKLGLPMDFVAGLVFAGVMLRQRCFSGSHWPLLAPVLCHMAANLVLLMLQRCIIS